MVPEIEDLCANCKQCKNEKTAGEKFTKNNQKFEQYAEEESKGNPATISQLLETNERRIEEKSFNSKKPPASQMNQESEGSMDEMDKLLLENQEDSKKI